MILGEKIAEERKKNGWSQEELAEKLAVSRQAVSKWESAQSVPDLQRVIRMAELFEVSTDYLLKDELEAEVLGEKVHSASAQQAVRTVSMEEANEFMDFRRKNASSLAGGVALCILSPVLLIFLEGLSDAHIWNMTEGAAGAIGLSALLILIAIGVFIFVSYGMHAKPFEYMEKECFETAYGVTGLVRERAKEFSEPFTRNVAVGVVLCIVATIPLLIAGAMDLADYICTGAVSLLLVFIAAGVYLIVRVSLVKDSYDTLLQEGDYSATEKKLKKKTDVFATAYWCTATAIYLGWSFWTMRWDTTWILWPVAGVLFAALLAVVRGVGQKDESKTKE